MFFWSETKDNIMTDEAEAKKRGARSNQKLKIMYLLKILMENTDDEHSLTLKEIQEYLENYNVTCERKSLYSDIEQLRSFGVDVISIQKNRNYYYHIGNRRFELPELKLLVDAVQSSKFITEKKSRDLIKKLEQYASKYEASLLHRQVYVSGRIKTMNDSIYLNVDEIHQAIATKRKITFQYFNWNTEKKTELRHNGEYYKVSPWVLTWEDENYYLVAFDDKEQKIKHYRVDKMLHISVVDEKREGKKHFDNFDLGEYSKEIFGMFDGEKVSVSLLCENWAAGIMIDRFGKDVRMRKADDEHFTCSVKVKVNRHFISWVMALGNGVKIIGPDSVVDMVREEIKRMIEQYM